MPSVLLMYSGGLDSLLSICRLVNAGYFVYFVHFDNGCTKGVELVNLGAERIEKHFGKERVKYLKTESIVHNFWRFRHIENFKFSHIASKYPDATISQYQCLLCRSSMYQEALEMALELNIPYIAEGARKSQSFAIEQPAMLKEYRKFLNEYHVDLLLPVFEITNDEERKRLIEDIWIDGYGVYEDQCVLGYPLSKKHPVDDETTSSIVKMFQELILPDMKELMKKKSKNQFIRNYALKNNWTPEI